jgi:hypothetical protein
VKTRRKETSRKTRCRWVHNIKMNLRDIGRGGMDWIELVQDRDQWRALVNILMNLQVLQNIEKFLNSCTTGSFSKKLLLYASCCVSIR